MHRISKRGRISKLLWKNLEQIWWEDLWGAQGERGQGFYVEDWASV
jgi:hypothetical protein